MQAGIGGRCGRPGIEVEVGVGVEGILYPQVGVGVGVKR